MNTNEMNFDKPFLIEFPKIGNSSLGYISVAENYTLLFEVKRIYWTYFTPESVLRGRHAHHDLDQILVAVNGKIIVNTEMPDGNVNSFILQSPNVGVYLPKHCWHTMQYSHNSVQMCIASGAYDENDYVRDYEDFKKMDV